MGSHGQDTARSETMKCSLLLLLLTLYMTVQGEVVDQMQDKTDSVDVVVDVNGQPFDDYRDVGNKRNSQLENDKKLPYEPSFGWVGRTDLDLSYIPGSHSRSGDYEATYPDYEDEARPRNEFVAQPQYDQFGFGFSRSVDEAVEGFGDDDLFYDVNNQEHIDNNQRAGDDYDSDSGKHYKILFTLGVIKIC